MIDIDEVVGLKARHTGQAPYLEFEKGDWTFRVLKRHGKSAKRDARWFCEVSSPFTFGSSDLGDVYVREVVDQAMLTKVNGEEPTEEHYDAVASLWAFHTVDRVARRIP